MGLDFMDKLEVLTDQPRRAVPRKRYRAVTGHAETLWRDAIWLDDDSMCRCCKRTLRRTDGLFDDRGECHHLQGRRFLPLRTDIRNGVLLCGKCHADVTERRVVIRQAIGSHMFKLDGRPFCYINGRKKLKFQRRK